MPQDSLKIIESLLAKEVDELNPLDIALAHKHLLSLYEYFQNVDTNKIQTTTLGNSVEISGDEEDAIKEEVKTPRKSTKPKEEIGLFEVNLFEGTEEEVIPVVEPIPFPDAHKKTFKMDIDEEAPVKEVIEVKDEMDNYDEFVSGGAKPNPLIDDMKLVDKGKGIIEEQEEETTEAETLNLASEVEIKEEVAENEALEEQVKVEEEVKDVIENEEEVLQEDIVIQPESEPEIESDNENASSGSNISNLSIAFEPPLSQNDFLDGWQPVEEITPSVFEEQTKSRFTDVEADLHLTKKQEPKNDIRNLIGLNDRYLYSNELFLDKKIYEEVLDELNLMSSKDEALTYLQPYLNKKTGDVDAEAEMDEVKESFYKLLDQHFG